MSGLEQKELLRVFSSRRHQERLFPKAGIFLRRITARICLVAVVSLAAIPFSPLRQCHAQSVPDWVREVESSRQIVPLKNETLAQMIGLTPLYIMHPLPPEETQHLLGGGYARMTNALLKRGIDFQLGYWSQFAANISGGTAKHQDYAHQIGLNIGFDLDRIMGVSNTKLFFSGTERAGRNLGYDALGDNTFRPTQIYGGGGNVLFHLIYFYIQKSWADDRLRWIIGRYAVGPDYNFSMLNCTFGALAICGQPRATTFLPGYVSWPSTAWGTNVKVRPTPDTYIVPGLFVSNPKRGGTAGTAWGDASGVTLVGEMGWEPEFGPHEDSGHYKIGILWDSSSYRYNNARNTLDLGSRKGILMTWAAFDQMIWRHGSYQTAGLILLGGYTHVTSAITQISDQAYVGLIDFGAIKSRPYDGVAVEYSQGRYGANFAAAYQPSYFQGPLYAQSQGRPVMASLERIFEVTYRIHVARGVYFSPEYQRIWRPGGGGYVKDASVFSFDLRVFL
ncbi:carbohydrate porin [Swaminathania salitolerans]|uniref:carbohydrate porin n=1 Tax=Swaminathania salitolerans TaxID=182838 RepID=UPI00222F5948|nr:carbohydrate porin [Swaminathania salitolerans]